MTKQKSKISGMGPVACRPKSITDESLARYRQLIDEMPRSAVRDTLDEFHRAVAKWWELPESTKAEPRLWNTSGGRKLTEQPMDQEIIDELFELVPWPEEMPAKAELINQHFANQPETELKRAAYHLLWYATELSLDREPCTMDKVK